MNNLENQIELLRRIISEFKYTKLQRELDDVIAFYESKKCSLSIIGSKCSGKCTLANSLVGTDLLPTSMFKSNVLYDVSLGENEVSLLKDNGDFKKLGSVSDIQRVATGNYDSIVYVKSDKYQLLSNLSLKTGFDLDNDCPELGYSLSDVVIVCVNATRLFSLKEMSALETLRNLSHKNIIVCVTHIDLIPEREISDVIKHIESKHLSCPLFYYSNKCGYVAPELIYESYGIDKINQCLANALSETMSVNNSRNSVVNAIIDNIASKCIFMLNVAKSDLEKQKEENYNQYLAKKAKIESVRLGWEDIRVNYKKRESQCVNAILSEMKKSKEKMLSHLQTTIVSVQNPKEWWEKIFPLTYKTDIDNVTSAIDNRIQSQLIKDFNWLNSELMSRFRQNVKDANIDSGESNFDYNFDLSSLSLDNLQSARYLTMAGGAALASLMFLVVGPVGAIASASAGIVGDKVIRKSIEQQKASLTVEVNKIVDDTFMKMSELVPARVQGLYGEVMRAICEREQVWTEEANAVSFESKEQTVIDNIANYITLLTQK